MQDIIVFMQHHASQSIALAVVLGLLIFLEFIRQTKGTSNLSPGQVTQFINHKNAVIVDIRASDAFVSGHILSAISVPLKELATSKKLDKLKTQPIVLVCATGVESPRAAATLKKQALDVYTLAGGLRAWKEANLPLVKN